MAEIKISELSIGDWVRYRDADANVRVSSIYSDGYVFIVGEEDSGISESVNAHHHIEPIPLTPEILEKNGFEKKNYDNGKRWDWWWDNVLVRKFADEDIYRFIVVFNSKHYTTMMVVGKHTHQLQHALRLAGVEKEIEV